MIIHPAAQGTGGWIQSRLGVPTCSQLDRIFQPRKRNPSKGQEKYRADLIVEYLTGQPIESFTSEWTRRGTEMESDARFVYELEHGVLVQRTGFVTRDDGKFGGSPDGLVRADRVLEIKCPAPHVHAEYAAGKDPGYVGQCQGLLYVTERETCDLWLYHPDAKPVLRVIERDEEYISAMTEVLNAFIEELEGEKDRLSRARRRA